MESFKKNVRGWKPSESDYRLMFREINGEWREITNNLPRLHFSLLADYLQEMGIDIDPDCIFCRIKRDNLRFEYRDFGSYVRIDVEYL